MGSAAASVGRALRASYGVASILVVESLLVGLSAAPGLVTFRWILAQPVTQFDATVRLVALGFAFVPSYFVFCLVLMTLSPIACRLLGWRSVRGEHGLAEQGWPIVRWAQYNSAIHVVRVLAGGVFRATIIWSWYLKLNGAKLGRDVHINTLAIYDHNLLSFGDHVVIGSDVKLSAHVAQKGKVIIAPVKLGSRVTIGTNSIVQPDVEIGDRTQIAVMSLVPRGARLEGNATYAGIPVELLKRDRPADEDEDTFTPMYP